MWISLLVANQKDPGFLARNTDDYHRSIKQIAYYDEWKSHRGKILCFFATEGIMYPFVLD